MTIKEYFRDFLYSYSRAKWLRGHLSLGRKVTVYGANAMSFMIEVRTKRYGIICLRLLSLDKRWPACLYFSPNGTPWACTFCRGLGPQEQIRAQVRRLNFGHNFRSDEEPFRKQLRKLNCDFDWLTKYEWRAIEKQTA